MSVFKIATLLIIYEWFVYGHAAFSRPGMRYITYLRTYNPRVRPVYDVDRPTNVTLTVSLSQIISVNEANDELIVSCWIQQSWYDEMLDTNLLEGERLIRVNFYQDELWSPDTVLYNGLEEGIGSALSGGHWLQAAKDSLGTKVSQVFPVTFRVACSMDLHQYPFDKQICSLHFGSSVYDSTEILYSAPESASQNQIHSNKGVHEPPPTEYTPIYSKWYTGATLRPVPIQGTPPNVSNTNTSMPGNAYNRTNGFSTVEQLLIGSYQKNAVWDLLEYYVQHNFVPYACCQEPYSAIQYTIVIKRKYTTGLVITILPLISVILVTITGLLRPKFGNGNEKAVFSAVNMVMLWLVYSASPVDFIFTSSKISYLGMFFLLTSVYLSVSALTCLVISFALQHRLQPNSNNCYNTTIDRLDRDWRRFIFRTVASTTRVHLPKCIGCQITMEESRARGGQPVDVSNSSGTPNLGSSHDSGSKGSCLPLLGTKVEVDPACFGRVSSVKHKTTATNHLVSTYDNTACSNSPFSINQSLLGKEDCNSNNSTIPNSNHTAMLVANAFGLDSGAAHKSERANGETRNMSSGRMNAKLGNSKEDPHVALLQQISGTLQILTQFLSGMNQDPNRQTVIELVWAAKVIEHLLLLIYTFVFAVAISAVAISSFL